MENLKTPAYVIDEGRLIENCKILKDVADRSGAKILLAQKAYSAFVTYPVINKYLAGTTASGLYEARLGFEKFGKETHIFSPAYKEEEIDEIVKYCDHVIFNSFGQLNKYKERVLSRGKSVGLRINPEHSTQKDVDIYDPCAKFSRLGVTFENFKEDELEGVSGLHMHTLCEQNSDALAETVEAFEKKFGKYLYNMKWLNLGGGHHITKEDYDVELLISCIKYLRETYDVEIYLEPGEAVALNAGYMVTSVIDIIHNGMDIAILDVSAACHMPDVIEMPYRPPLKDSYEAGKEGKHTYRLAGPTCLAGDVIGDYSFDKELNIGDKLVFEDMAIYSMVKNNTFNGMALPDILIKKADGSTVLHRRFGYEEFVRRL